MRIKNEKTITSYPYCKHFINEYLCSGAGGAVANGMYRASQTWRRFRPHLYILSVPVPVGKFLLINNLFWLHGRDRFTPHPDLRRELMRQRGYFAYAASHYQTHQ